MAVPPTRVPSESPCVSSSPCSHPPTQDGASGERAVAGKRPKRFKICAVDPGIVTTASAVRLDWESLVWCQGRIPCMAGDATGKRQHHTAKYVVKAGGELVGRAGHVRVGDGMKVITVEFLAIGKQRYYGLMGSSVARFRGADAYRPLEAAVEAAKEKAFATGDRKDKAEVSRLMRDLRRRGWRPQPVTDTIEALKGLSMARAVADGAGATLRVAAQRLHLLLDGSGAYWTWTRSATTRRLAFQREMTAYRGIEHMLQYLAPRDKGQETLLTIGHFPGRRSFSNGIPGQAPPQARQPSTQPCHHGGELVKPPLCHMYRPH